MNQPIFNPSAPPLLNGFNATSPDNCEDVEGGHVWPLTGGFQILTANQILPVTLVLDNDTDFRFMAFQWALQSVDDQATPGFLYRIKRSDGTFMSDGFIYCMCTPGTFTNPWPQFPHETYAVHQRIQFEIQNAADFSQGVQLVFRGAKRWRRV